MASNKQSSSRSGGSGTKGKSSKSKSSNSNSRSKKTTNKSSRSSEQSHAKATKGSAAPARNPSQEAAGEVGDEGHARVRPTQTRSVVSGDDGDSSQKRRPREQFKDYS